MADPAFDAVSESHTGTTPSTSEASFSWSHDPVGVPKGVVVFTVNLDSATDTASAVTYGGASLAAVTGGFAADTATEPGNTKAWFLGASVPTNDPATVVVTRTNNSNAMWAACITLTADGDTEIVGTPVLLEDDGTVVEQNIDSGAVVAVRFAAIYSGRLNAPPPDTNSTALVDIDLGARTASVVRETTAGSGSRPVGFNVTIADDRAAVHLAVAQAAAGGTTVTPAVLAVTVTLPTPTILAASKVTPAVIPVTVSLPTPTIVVEAGGTTVTPAVIAATVTLPTPTAKGAATVQPAVIPVTVTLPTPTILAAAKTTPAVLAVTAALPTPTILAAVRVTPAVVAVTSSLPTPATLAAARVTPAVISVTVSLPTPTVLAGAKVTPAVIPVTVTLPTPTIVVGDAPTVVNPATIAASVSLPTPVVSIPQTVTPTVLAVAAALPLPTIRAAVAVSPSTIVVLVGLPTPATTTAANVAPAVLALTVTFPGPTIILGLIVKPRYQESGPITGEIEGSLRGVSQEAKLAGVGQEGG